MFACMRVVFASIVSTNMGTTTPMPPWDAFCISACMGCFEMGLSFFHGACLSLGCGGLGVILSGLRFRFVVENLKDSLISEVWPSPSTSKGELIM